MQQGDETDAPREREKKLKLLLDGQLGCKVRSVRLSSVAVGLIKSVRNGMRGLALITRDDPI